MAEYGPKKMTTLRIWQILSKYSDCDHPLKQEDIINYLDDLYGITLERKAVGRALADLSAAGYDIESTRGGSFAHRDFEDSELKLLIDGVLQSKYITASHSKDLIDRLCSLSNVYFRSHVKNVYSVNDWSKTDNAEVLLNIDVIDEAIAGNRQVQYNYNKYGVDAKLHKSSFQRLSPYSLILHNQKYYLMGYSEYWKTMTFQRLDRMTNMEIHDVPRVPLESIKGYENGVDFKQISSAMPYMYADKPERVVFVADAPIVDQIIDWFGKDVQMRALDDGRVEISLLVSLNAMEYWAMQYLNHVEVLEPASLRERIRNNLTKGVEKYQ